MASPLTLQSLPRAILHIDGDAFFASCEQSRRPQLQGRPVVTGKERGIAASMSYEAKARGVRRGMRLADIRKICPEAVILPTDYETYSLLSTRFFAIVRRYTPEVEAYSIDECFCDVTGLRRPLRMSYVQIAERIKHDLDTELGFTFSVGLAPNKVVAKIASKWAKPSGLTTISGRELHRYLAKLSVEHIWGIGHQTTALLQKTRRADRAAIRAAVRGVGAEVLLEALLPDLARTPWRLYFRARHWGARAHAFHPESQDLHATLRQPRLGVRPSREKPGERLSQVTEVPTRDRACPDFPAVAGLP